MKQNLLQNKSVIFKKLSVVVPIVCCIDMLMDKEIKVFNTLEW